MVPKTTAYKRWNCQVIRPANCCHFNPSNRSLDGFPGPSQFTAAKPTHYSTIPHRPSDSSRPWQRLLLSGDVHQNHGLTTKYPCHKSWSDLYGKSLFWLGSLKVVWSSKRIGVQTNKNSSCSSPPLQSPITTKASGNKQVELGEFLERHKVKVEVIQRSP